MNHLRIGTRILLALALPVLGLLAVAGYVVLEKQRLLVEAQALRQLVSFAGEVGTLVHQLQLERGQSTVFVSAPDLPADDIHAQWRASDDSRQRFRALGQAFLRRQLDPSLSRHLGIALSDLKGIDTLRQRIGDRQLSPLATVQTYTLTINRLLDLAGQLPALSSDGRISGLAAAYVSLLQGKERAGRERAIGAGLFGTRDRDAEAYRLFVALGAQQHAFFTDFRGFATSDLVAMLDEGLESGQDEFHRMRATVLDSVVTGHFGTVTAAEWFAVATRRIDRLRDVEAKVNGALMTQVNDNETEARSALVMTAVLVSGALALTGILVPLVVRGIVRPVTTLTGTMVRLAQGDVGIAVEGMGWRNEIGSMSRAVEVFRENKIRADRLAEELGASEKRYRAVIETVKEGIVITDPQGRIQAVNPAYAGISGQSAEALLGHLLEVPWPGLREQGFWEGEVSHRQADGGLCVSLASVVAVQGTEGEVLHYAGIFHDITARKEDETRIWRQANFDALTGLPNRSMFHDRLDQAVTQASRDKARFAVAFVDLDGFKAVNDTLGHAAGDLLLKETAQRLKKMLRASDTVARLSGDEFTMILHSGNPEGVAEVARRLIDSLTEPFLLDGKPAHVRASVGIALFPAHGEDAESLLRRADAAMYRAKRNGKGRFEFAETEVLPA